MNDTLAGTLMAALDAAGLPRYLQQQDGDRLVIEVPNGKAGLRLLIDAGGIQLSFQRAGTTVISSCGWDVPEIVSAVLQFTRDGQPPRRW
jgi:hypothetical protein